MHPVSVWLLTCVFSPLSEDPDGQCHGSWRASGRTPLLLQPGPGGGGQGQLLCPGQQRWSCVCVWSSDWMISITLLSCWSWTSHRSASNRILCLQTTRPGSWRAGTATTACRRACTRCPWSSRTETSPCRAAPTRWPCESAPATATATWSCATPRRWRPGRGWAPGRWWPSCCVSSSCSVSHSSRHLVYSLVSELKRQVLCSSFDLVWMFYIKLQRAAAAAGGYVNIIRVWRVPDVSML